jgi:hypothetical protein
VLYLVKFEFAVYITIGALSLVIIVLALMFSAHAINVTNAITASYVIMRSIGLIMGYPYEFVIYYEIHQFQTREGFVSTI